MTGTRILENSTQKLLAISRCRTTWTQPVVTLLLALALTGVFWVVTIPAAIGRLMTPTEMIETGLPPGTMLKTASKPEFLAAVRAAVKNHRKSAPGIARAAVAAHREYSGDIVAAIVRSTGGEGKADCALTGEIVAAAIAAWPDSASVMTDAALSAAPACADAIQSGAARDGREVVDRRETTEDVPAEGPGNFGVPAPTYLTAPLGSVGGGGGGFNPQQPVIQVCDNGRQRGVPASRVDHFLNTHPGSFVGSCQITPVASR